MRVRWQPRNPQRPEDVPEAGECRQRRGPRYLVTIATKQQIASLRRPAFVQGPRPCRTAHPHPTAEPSWIRHVETIEPLRALLAFKYTYKGSGLTERHGFNARSRFLRSSFDTPPGHHRAQSDFPKAGAYKREPTAIARRRYRLIYAASPPRLRSCYTCWGPIREEAMISGGGANRLCPPALAWGYTSR